MPDSPRTPAPAGLELRKLRLVTDQEIANRRGPSVPAHQVPDVVDELEDAGGVDEQVPAGEVLAGDLVLVQDSPQAWGLVESAEPDVGEEDLLCIDWRGDHDDAVSLVVPEDSFLTVRRWPNEAPDASSSTGEPRSWPWGE